MRRDDNDERDTAMTLSALKLENMHTYKSLVRHSPLRVLDAWIDWRDQQNSEIQAQHGAYKNVKCQELGALVDGLVVLFSYR